MGAEFVQLSLVPLAIAVLAAITCAIPGNFLLLRRQSLVGDAISHVVLPGIVIAFLITGVASTAAMLTGAGVAAAVSAVLIEFFRRIGRVEPGAAMGVVFTTMFAGGVLLLETGNLGNVHLDVEHTLYGNIESLVWLSAESWNSLLDPLALASLPPQLPRLMALAVLMAGLVAFFWRPLSIATFDETFAETIGLPVRLIGLAIIFAAAIAAVAAFEAVGSIIVIAMFVCPPATARLLTDNLAMQLVLSIVVAALAAVLGYITAGYGPGWLGFPLSVSAAGMIAAMSGVFLAAACLWGRRRRGHESSPSGQS